jgi:radical SAM protein with 4Fe4S-binding SPASM domain
MSKFKTLLEVNSQEIETLFTQREKYLQEKIDAHPLEIVLWEATRACNLRCIHCGTPADNIDRTIELTKEGVLQVFQQIKKDFNNATIKYVSITGGEPTCREDLIEIIRGIKNIGFSEIVIHSNGHRLAGEPGYLDALVEAGIGGIGINLDGLEKTHNRIRNHKNSYRLSRAVCAKIVERNDRIDTLISTVVTKENLVELPKLREEIFDLNPDRWRLIPLEPIGRALEQMPYSTLSYEDMEQLIYFILESRLIAEEKPNLVQTEMGCGQWVGKKLEGLIRPYIWHCIAGINTLGILYDGTIASCNNIHPHFSEGNIRQNNIKDVWENRFKTYRNFEWKRKGECVDCSDWDLCHGGEMHRRLPDGEMIGTCFYASMKEGEKHAV